MITTLQRENVVLTGIVRRDMLAKIILAIGEYLLNCGR
jgi:hypothetical protein